MGIGIGTGLAVRAHRVLCASQRIRLLQLLNGGAGATHWHALLT